MVGPYTQNSSETASPASPQRISRSTAQTSADVQMSSPSPASPHVLPDSHFLALPPSFFDKAASSHDLQDQHHFAGPSSPIDRSASWIRPGSSAIHEQSVQSLMIFGSSPIPVSPEAGPSTTSSHASNGLAPNVASLASADFEVDVRTGFLPATINVDRLPAPFDIWEDALDAAMGTGCEDEGPDRGLTLGGKREKDVLWRKGIQAMSVLDAEELATLPLLRRAHLVIAYLLHFYAHTEPAQTGATKTKQPVRIPRSISIPLSIVSPKVGLPPVLTYADTVLYNFHSLNPTAAMSYAINPPTRALTTFTRTSSEEQFYIISALCEIAGAEALRLMRRSLDEMFVADELALRRLTQYLRKLAVQIDRIGDITLGIMKGVDPEEFYHLIRPWFRGGDADGPTSAGWIYEGVDDGVWGLGENDERNGRAGGGKMFSGPSAGQSSLIHAIDIFLTVDHTEQAELGEVAGTNLYHVAEAANGVKPASAVVEVIKPEKINLNHEAVTEAGAADAAAQPSSHGHGHASAAAPARPKANETTFLRRMLQYMPLQHRTFLLHLASTHTPLRPLIVATQHSHPKLAEAYDGALAALKRFREKHMRIVSLFIVQQARRQPSERIRRMMGEVVSPEEEEAVAAAAAAAASSVGEVPSLEEMRGTGGTPLFKFLKRCRDNTTKAMVGKRAGPDFELV